MMDASKERTVFGLFPPDTPIEPLLEELRLADIAPSQLAVTSAIPFATSVPQHRSPQTPLHVLAVVAGLVGIAVGVLLSGGTAALYPILTGGKPIVALPVVAIISYETMMLFAIVTTFIGMVLRFRRAQEFPIPHDPRIHDGYIGCAVRVSSTESSLGSAIGLLKRHGAVEVINV